MWLLEQGAVLTKDNMRKRNWNGDPTCRFCANTETVEHLLFQCPITKVVWGIVAHSIGANNVPKNVTQYWIWIEKHFPEHKHMHAFGLAAICWATWKARNKACFDYKLIRHPAKIVCHACSFMNFWTDLQKTEFQTQLMDDVKILLAKACCIMASQRYTTSAPSCLLLRKMSRMRKTEESCPHWSSSAFCHVFELRLI